MSSLHLLFSYSSAEELYKLNAGYTKSWCIVTRPKSKASFSVVLLQVLRSDVHLDHGRRMVQVLSIGK